MSHSYIFITQTQLDSTKLNACMCGFHQALCQRLTPKQVFDTYQQTTGGQFLENELYQYTQLLEKGKVLVPNLQRKEKIQEFLNDLYITRKEELYCIVGDISILDESVQEGMLKILEEPPSKVIFFLSAQNTSSIKPTILSRSHLVYIPQPLLIHMLDIKLNTEIKKLLPDYKSALQSIIEKKESYSTPIEYKKIERIHIDGWLWQLLYSSEKLFVSGAISDNVYTFLTHKITLALAHNQKLVQKKLVLETLIS